MNYPGTIKYLYDLRKYGFKFGLQNITRLMDALHNPHRKFRSVHVAGTNGKGSTAALISSILRQKGLRVGLFTSPHLVSFTERIQVNGREISGQDVSELTAEIRKTIENLEDFCPTFFEVVTAMAMLYFKKQGVDTAVVEVGMGGRLDATNILLPEVSVLTPVGIDHSQFLGNSLRDIAREKAGIIKQNVPVVSAQQELETKAVIREVSEERDSPLFLYGKDFHGSLRSFDLNGLTFDYLDRSCHMKNLFVPLTGHHQLMNSCVAIKSALQTFGASSHDISNVTDRGLRSVRWPGRFDLISTRPPIIIDGAHNPAAAHALAKTLQKTFGNGSVKTIMVFGIMSDKDIEGILYPLLPLATKIICTAPGDPRAATPAMIAHVASSLGFPEPRTAATVKEALALAEKLSHEEHLHSDPDSRECPIVITGSFYTIGEAMEALGETALLGDLRESL